MVGFTQKPVSAPSLLNSRTERRSFFMRCRRTDVLNNNKIVMHYFMVIVTTIQTICHLASQNFASNCEFP